MNGQAENCGATFVGTAIGSIAAMISVYALWAFGFKKLKRPVEENVIEGQLVIELPTHHTKAVQDTERNPMRY